MKVSAPTNLFGSKVNSLGMVLVPVPGTKVLMCVHETRYQDHAAFMAANPQQEKRPVSANGLWGWEDYPVFASWEEANAFCVWLSQKEGKKYRLPTDEEWSYAVGIGTKEKRGQDTPEMLEKMKLDLFPWGTAWPPPEGSGNLGDLSHRADHAIWHSPDLAAYDDGFSDPAPVMSYKPNKLGIYDLAGNVAEWCADWYSEAGGQKGHVIRGSQYSSDSRSQNLSNSRSFRISSSPLAHTYAGYRIVLEP